MNLPDSLDNLPYFLLVIGTAYFTVLLPASQLVRRFLEPWVDQLPHDSMVSSLMNAGSMIGCLERLLMLTFILLDEFTAVGFVLALKATYRFKDTDDRARAEYLLMGTFLSLTVTLAVGLSARLALSITSMQWREYF